MTMLLKNNLIFFFLLSFLTFTYAHADTEQLCNHTPEQPKETQTLKNIDSVPMDLVGELPTKLAWIIEQINTSNTKSIRNRLLLYGPPGNGKTTLARACAQLTKSMFISISAPSLVTQYQGSGAEAISYAFYEAANTAQENNKNVIIFIDEIDAIAAVNNDKYVDHKAALQQLWLELDTHKNNPHIFVIVATNRYEQLDKAFIDRFGNNIIELTYPDANLRAKVLAHYFAKQGLTVNNTLQKKLAKKSDSLSIRCLEDLVSDIRMATDMDTTGKSFDTIAWESLNAAKKKFKNNKTHEDENAKIDAKINRIYTIMGIVSIGIGYIFSAQQLKNMASPTDNKTQKITNDEYNTLNERITRLEIDRLITKQNCAEPCLTPQP